MGVPTNAGSLLNRDTTESRLDVVPIGSTTEIQVPKRKKMPASCFPQKGELWDDAC